MIVGEREGIAPPSIMERRVALLRRVGTEVEYHKYPDVGHGFGLGTGTSAEGWAENAVRFWKKQIKRALIDCGVPDAVDNCARNRRSIAVIGEAK